MNKYAVFSVNSESCRSAVDCVWESNPNVAMQRVAGIREQSHIVVALTPAQLRELADKMEAMTAEQIVSALKDAQTEETLFQVQRQAVG